MADDWKHIERVGYRKPLLTRKTTGDHVNPATGDSVSADVPLQRRQGQAILSICTYNHSHYARTLFESIRRFHPDLPLFLVVADAERSGFPEIPGVRMIDPRQLGLPDFPFLALKYSATDLCCSLKPAALRWLMATSNVSSIVYLDSDVCVYAPIDGLLEATARHRAVVIPHVRAPMPSPERFWERPTLGDLAYAGVLNAGMFGLAVSSETVAFLETWLDMVTQPGAFLSTLGGQHEQNSFNWIVSFLDGLHVLKDPAYNAAYWNLHDRSLRWKGLDGAEDRWTVDGEPLVCFHFSGYRIDEPLALSTHDRRHSLFHMPSLSRLTEDYAARLRGNGADTYGRTDYVFGCFGGAIKIEPRMRRIFQEEEIYLRREIDPWTPEGEAYYCEALLAPVPHRGSLLPVLLESIYRERPDLQQQWPDADLKPEQLLPWFTTFGAREYNCQALFEKYRQVIPTRRRVELTHARVRPSHAPDTPPGSDLMPPYPGEYPFVTKMAYVRAVYERRPDVQSACPDVFFGNAPDFVRWMSLYGMDEELIPEECVEAFERCSAGRSLARIFSFLNRMPEFVEMFPLALVGEACERFAREMLRVQRDGLEFDVDDVVTYLWMMERAPWSGLELTIELLPHLCRKPSSRLPEGAQMLVGHLSKKDARFAAALDGLRRGDLSPAASVEYQAIRAWEATASRPVRAVEYLRQRRLVDGDPPSDSPAPQTNGECGANLFGYFKSPIGLGEMSRGLASALSMVGVRTARSVIGNIGMEDDLAPADFIRTFRHEYDRNIFVSYPHLDGMVLNQYPVWMTGGRENIAYLAWEQRDGSHYWREVFEGFDQIWALSTFAARSLERCLERPVHAVPCVLDVDRLPPPATKQKYGLDPDAMVFLYVFDANSSIERKNPEAALRAFVAAFGPRDRVQLCIKLTNSHRMEHRNRLRAFLRDAAELGSRVKIIGENLSRPDTLRLISSVDCYMSLHRAEGFGYTCAEAMGYGVPVIATRYSGNLDFMDDDTAYLVEAREVEVSRAEGPFQRGSVWAEPDLDSAVDALQSIFQRRDESRARGLRGREFVRSSLSSAAIGRRVATLLRLGHMSLPEQPAGVPDQAPAPEIGKEAPAAARG